MTPRACPVTLAEALRTANDTRVLEIGPDALDRTPGVFREQFPGRPGMIIADQNTFAVAGERLHRVLSSAGVAVLEPFVFRTAELPADLEFVLELESCLRANDAIPVGVGSGTINDLSKLASYRTGRPYVCVATAASMDGYTAFGASITDHGHKQTFACPAPRLVVADLGIICAAPAPMNSSGYADLLAKVPSGADWLLAEALAIEPIHPAAWNIVQGGLRAAVADPAAVHAGEPGAINRLVEGLMLSGFAMQAAQASRPASGAEHQFSHLWDMEHHTHQGRAPWHGFKVGVGTLAVTALYECLFRRDLEAVDVGGCCAEWPEQAAWLEQVRRSFAEPQLRAVAERETGAKSISAGQLRGELERLRRLWPELRERLQQQLIPFNTLKEMLRQAGAATEPEQIGITRRRLRESFRLAWHIRRRYTVLDLAVRVGCLEAGLDEIFGPSGPWPLSAPRQTVPRQGEARSETKG